MTTTPHHDQTYNCLNFFVSQPIFIFGHMIGMARPRVVMEPDFLILMLAGNGRALKYVYGIAASNHLKKDVMT